MLRCSMIGRYFGCYKRNINKIDWKDTIPFVAPIEGGQVIKVYDGDTITIAAKLPYRKSPLYRFSVRLNGIDCPEIKGNNNSEKECAKLGRDMLSNMILNKYVRLKEVKGEKYGRLLAEVYFEGKHINNWLLRNNLAVRYDGGTKISPEDWMKYHKEVEFTDIWSIE